MEEALLLLETPLIVRLVRDDAYGRRVNAELDLSRRRIRPLVLIVSVAEAHAFALRRTWGPERRARLSEVVSELVVAPISSMALAIRFGEIQVKTQRIGRAIGQNDIWIAATCALTGATLVTHDRDFDPLVPNDIRRVLLDTASGAVLERPEDIA